MIVFCQVSLPQLRDSCRDRYCRACRVIGALCGIASEYVAETFLVYCFRCLETYGGEDLPFIK
jgi:hypothetical protein